LDPNDLLKKYGMELSCKSVSTPLESSLKLSKDQFSSSKEQRRKMVEFFYKLTVGSLMYAMVCTRLDIVFVVGIVSRHLVNSRNTHWSIVERIMQYIKGTSNHGLLYKGTSIQHLLPKTNVICHGYSNANWVDDIDTRKSTSRYPHLDMCIIFLAIISWTNKRKITIALSSTKAKYMVYTLVAKEAICSYAT
jgi:hypothetical protein